VLLVLMVAQFPLFLGAAQAQHLADWLWLPAPLVLQEIVGVLFLALARHLAVFQVWFCCHLAVLAQGPVVACRLLAALGPQVGPWSYKAVDPYRLRTGVWFR
jgi:hypothetical protein